MLGNVLDHYDMALYTFLVPFIAPVFFPNHDHITQLIMGYGITIISLFSRPLGSFIFGTIAMHLGTKFVLFITLIGVAASTSAIGLIPDYNNIGIWSGIILVMVRFIQGVFAAGEQSVASLFVLDQVSGHARISLSSYYQASSMAGAMLASAAAWVVSMTGQGALYWRYAFFTGAITGLIALILRFMILDHMIPKPQNDHKLYQFFIIHKVLILKIILVSSTSYMTFAVPFVFLNKFISIVADVKLSDMMAYNSIIMLMDILLLPIFGKIAQKYQNPSRWMSYAALLLILTSIPGFYLMNYLDFYGLLAVKIWFVVVGVAFSAPSKAWLYSLIHTQEKYMITGLGYAIGSAVLGGQTTTICWILWNYTQNIIAPGVYMTLLASCAFWALRCKK